MSGFSRLADFCGGVFFARLAFFSRFAVCDSAENLAASNGVLPAMYDRPACAFFPPRFWEARALCARRVGICEEV